MGVLSAVTTRLSAYLFKATALTHLPSFAFVPEAKSGISVTRDVALQSSVVMNCLRVIAEGVSQTLPIRFYVPDSSGRLVRTRSHPLDRLLNKRPNPNQNAFEFFESMIFHLGLHGNAYVWKNTVGTKRELKELWLIPPDRVGVEEKLDGTLEYRLTMETGRQLVLTKEDVWHIRGPSYDTKLGLDVLRYAREAIGLSTALEQSHSALHKNGTRTTGIYTVPNVLTPEQFDMLRKWLIQQTAGMNEGTPLIIDRGATYTPTSMTGVDAQHLETRKFQIEEICRHFRVMPIMAGYSDKTATYASAEQMFIAHVVHTLSPWYRRLEMSIETSLMAEDDVHDVKFWDKTLLRGAAKDRAEYISRALGSGGGPSWWTQNEAREEDGLDPIAEDEYDRLPVALNTQQAAGDTADDEETSQDKPKEGEDE